MWEGLQAVNVEGGAGEVEGFKVDVVRKKKVKC
jgi:hypothetical protein